MATGITGLKTIFSELQANPAEEEKQPVLFIGHGSPANAVSDNAFTRALTRLGTQLKTPKAILVVSAHWLTKGTFAASTNRPDTIYDFYGFPEEMYNISYPSPGAPEFAELTKDLVTKTSVSLDGQWGLDHGAWTILKFLFPKADIPVFQVSIDFHKSTQYHYELGLELAALRKRGVLIIGSGNISHNLRKVVWDNSAKPFDWAMEFDEKIKEAVLKTQHSELINYKKWGHIADLAHPSNDHYLPLLYTAGASDKTDNISFPYEGFDFGSLSMRCIKFG